MSALPDIDPSPAITRAAQRYVDRMNQYRGCWCGSTFRAPLTHCPRCGEEWDDDQKDCPFADRNRKRLAKAHASGYPLEGRTTFQGLRISIENKKGNYREDKHHDPPRWRTKMLCDYGYIRGTEATDGDHADVFLGPNPEATTAFVVKQLRPDSGAFDEQKTMLGFDSEEEAKQMYLKHYDSPKFFGGIMAMPMGEFKSKVMQTLHGNKMVKAFTPTPRLVVMGRPAPLDDTGYICDLNGRLMRTHILTKAAQRAPQILVARDTSTERRRQASAPGALEGKQRVGGTGSSHKGSHWVSVHDSVHIPVAGKKGETEMVHGVVVSETKGYVWALTHKGTFAAPRDQVKKSGKSFTVNWPKLAQTVTPTPNSYVTVKPAGSAGAGEALKSTDPKLAQAVKRVLIGSVAGKGPNATVEVALVRPGRSGIEREKVKVSQISPYVPDRFKSNDVAGGRAKARPAKVKAREQLEAEASNLTYVNHLPKGKRDKLLAAEKAWFAEHAGALENLAKRVAARCMINREGAMDLVTHANIGALYGMREWERNSDEQRAKKLANMAKSQVMQVQGLAPGDPGWQAKVAAETKKLRSEYSSGTKLNQLRTRHVMARAWDEAMKRADELMDTSGMTGLNRADISKVVRAENEIWKDRGHKPTPEEVASRLGWTGESGADRVRLCLAKKQARAASRMSELEREPKEDIVEDKIVEPAAPDYEAEGERVELHQNILKLGKLAGLDERQMFILSEGLHESLDTAPKLSGGAKAIAALLRTKYGSDDTEGGVLKEWSVVQAKLGAWAIENQFLAAQVMGREVRRAA